MGRWRLAARLAWREVVRRPGRTLLVVLLIAVPVLGMTIGSVVARTAAAESAWERQWGSVDLVVSQPADDEVVVGDHVPVSATVTSGIWAGAVPIDAGGAIASAEFGEAAVAPRLTDTAGRMARDASEAWLSRPLLDRLGLAVGDRLALDHPTGSWTIVGTGRAADWLGSELFVVGAIDGELAAQFRPMVLRQRTLVDLRFGTTDAAAFGVEQELTAQLALDGAWIEGARHWSHEGEDVGRSLAWGWVAGALALAVTGIVVAAAFATSARRQLVTVGLLSCNGAPETTIRRSLMLQGSWSGLAGSLLGVGAGLVALAAGRPLLLGWFDRSLPGYRVALVDLVVIAATGIVAASLAALVPARTASRVPVMAALAGRRPLGAVPARLVPVGIALFGAGVFLLVVAATGDRGDNAGAAAGVLGGLLVLAGVCCASPLAIDAMSRAASAIGRSWGFAGRSLGRTRTRSAAVVTAIAVTVAAGCVVSAAVADVGTATDAGRTWPRDAVVAVVWPASTYVEGSSDGDPGLIDYGPLVDTPVPESAQTAVAGVVGGGRWYPRRMATWDAAAAPDDVAFQMADGSTVTFGPGAGIAIADESTMDLYALTAAERSRLAATGALLLDDWGWFVPIAGEELTGRVETEQGPLTFPLAGRQPAPTLPDDDDDAPPIRGVDAVMMTEDAARTAGFDIVTAGGFWRGDDALSRAEADALGDTVLAPEPSHLGWTYRDVPQPSGADPTLSFMYDGPTTNVSGAALQGLAVAGSLLLTLFVVAIGLALAATESRDERDVLVAIGARPATLRAMAGVKAVVMTATGVALGVPAGLIPWFAVVRANDDDLDVPWVGLAGFVLVLPAVAGGVAWASSSLAQRLRPVRMSTLTAD